MKCGTASCTSFPTIRVFWPGQTRDMCAECALRAKGIAEAMGFALSVAVIDYSGEDLASLETRESGGSIPAECPCGEGKNPLHALLKSHEPPVLNKSGGSPCGIHHVNGYGQLGAPCVRPKGHEGYHADVDGVEWHPRNSERIQNPSK